MTKDASVHFMQLPIWASAKNQLGWKNELTDIKSISRQVEVYKRSVPAIGNFFYIPGLGGVNTSTAKDFSSELRAVFKSKGFCLRLELDQPYDEELLNELLKNGWVKSKTHIQYRHTVVVDLSVSEDDIWMSLKSRGRYEILQAQKSGVRIEEVDATDENLKKMYELMQTTSTRNKFYIRDMKFAMEYWTKFRDLGQLKLFFAWHEDNLLSGAVILTNDNLAWYKDGGSTRVKANLMAARLLQWEAIKALKKAGITTYDLGGIPAPEIEAKSSMHGIYVFKTAYSKETVALMPTLDLPLSKRYALWLKVEAHWLRIYNLFASNLWY